MYATRKAGLQMDVGSVVRELLSLCLQEFWDQRSFSLIWAILEADDPATRCFLAYTVPSCQSMDIFGFEKIEFVDDV